MQLCNSIQFNSIRYHLCSSSSFAGTRLSNLMQDLNENAVISHIKSCLYNTDTVFLSVRRCLFDIFTGRNLQYTHSSVRTFKQSVNWSEEKELSGLLVT